MNSYSPMYRPTLIQPTPAPMLGKDAFKNAKAMPITAPMLEFNTANAGIRMFEPSSTQRNVEQAVFTGNGAHRAMFKTDVAAVDMTGEPGGISQAVGLGNTKHIFQQGQGATQDVFSLSESTQLIHQKGTHNKNYITTAGTVQEAVLEGKDNQNQITTGGIQRLYMGGTSSKGEAHLNDATIMGNAGQVLLEGEGIQNQASLLGDVTQLEVGGQSTENVLAVANHLGVASLNGANNSTALNGQKQMDVASVQTKNSNNAISAEAGIHRLASSGSGNRNEYFSYAGKKASEAVLHGEGNETLYAGTGQATVRVGGKGNETIISTSRLSDKPEQAADEATVAAQHDTLELGGSRNKTTADLGAGDDAIYVHNNKNNTDNQIKLDAGSGNNTLTLEGTKKEWTIAKGGEDTLLIMNAKTNQRIVAKQIDAKQVTFVETLPPGEVGFRTKD
jgi:hypothetical protein